jgi:hypothetical protein
VLPCCTLLSSGACGIIETRGGAAAATCPRDVPPTGVYKPRRPQASPLFRLVQDRFEALRIVYDERFAATYGPWRAVMGEVAGKFLACGILDHGFARVRCGACGDEYLLAFSCKARYFCPSCHAKRLALWTLWLEESLLAPVPHRQVVLTIPKRLRAYCLYRRRLLGDIARVAARMVTMAVRALTGERELAVGIVACLQTHGSLANWHPHVHLLVTDGGFRPDGTFVPWPAHDAAQLTEAFRRAVLRLFVRLELFDPDEAAGMLQWPHSGFHVHDAVWVDQDDHAFARRLARYCARNPVALERLTYDAGATQVASVTYRSDKTAGPTAGSETMDPLEFLARVLCHIPDKGQVTTRYYGWYANRPRGTRRREAERAAGGGAAVVVAPAVPLALREARRRWAELLRLIYEVDPLVCLRCGSTMRVVAVVTARATIDELLAHVRARSPPGRGAGASAPRPPRQARSTPPVAPAA